MIYWFCKLKLCSFTLNNEIMTIKKMLSLSQNKEFSVAFLSQTNKADVDFGCVFVLLCKCVPLILMSHLSKFK